MYLEKKSNQIELKLYVDNTWKFVKIKIKKRDLKYLESIDGK